MKNLLLLFSFAFFLSTVQATVLTVSNNPLKPAQYESFDAAQTAASNGDTVYIHGSTVLYPTITLSKGLTLIGPGWKPDKDLPVVSTIQDIKLKDSADNCRLYGLFVRGAIYPPLFSDVVDNVIVEGNYVKGGVTVAGNSWIIRDNIIDRFTTVGSNPLAGNNILIENNIIGGTNDIIVNLRNGILRNNILLTNTTGTKAFSSSCTGVLIENNIFWGKIPGTCATCTYNNNLAFLSNNDTLPPPGGASGTGNIFSQDPLFEDLPTPGSLSLADINKFWNYDFHLKPGSPAIGSGTNGTDMGVYGGNGFSDCGNANIPQMIEVNISNNTAPAGGTIQVEIKSTKPKLR